MYKKNNTFKNTVNISFYHITGSHNTNVYNALHCTFSLYTHKMSLSLHCTFSLDIHIKCLDQCTEHFHSIHKKCIDHRK